VAHQTAGMTGTVLSWIRARVSADALMHAAAQRRDKCEMPKKVL
jgi:hypothetical protein